MTQAKKRDEHGFAMVQLLITLLILGVMAAATVTTFSSLHPFSPSSSSTEPPCSGSTPQVGCYHYGSSAACSADALTLETAVAAYNALNQGDIGVEVAGTGPQQVTYGAPETYATATQASTLVDNGMLRNWPGSSTQGYALSLSTTTAGDVMIHVPANENGPGVDFANEGPHDGCNDPRLVS